MQSMFDCGWSGWVGGTLMAGAAFVALLILFVALLALAKYVFLESRRDRAGPT